uniref:Putative ovule protein n=1 Tax=Solanum chacoense TaxID=4108 RepID=A0A0V0H9P1_SOLCH
MGASKEIRKGYTLIVENLSLHPQKLSYSSLQTVHISARGATSLYISLSHPLCLFFFIVVIIVSIYLSISIGYVVVYLPLNMIFYSLGINRCETYQSNSHYPLAYFSQEKTSFQQ